MMEYNTNDQLRTYFIKQIQTISEQEISKVKSEIERITQKKLAEIQASAKLRADLMLQQETKLLTSEHSLNISRLTEQNNKKKMMMREQLIEDLFNTIKNKLQDYSKTEAYREGFTKGVQKATKQYPYNGLLHVKTADFELANNAIKNLSASLQVVEDESIVLGGFLLEFTEAALVVDETLDAKLYDEMISFYENPELIIE